MEIFKIIIFGALGLLCLFRSVELYLRASFRNSDLRINTLSIYRIPDKEG